MEFILLAGLWISFCVLHSALISITFTGYIKRRLPVIFRYHRILFNFISLATLIPVLVYSSTVRRVPFFKWNGNLLYVKFFFIMSGLIIVILGSMHYDAAAFTGLAQIRGRPGRNLLSKTGLLDRGGILGFIRHPFYTAVLILIWSNDIDVSKLVENIILSSYVVIGTFLEERKLVIEFGEIYNHYREEVSMFLPLKYIKNKFIRKIKGG